MEQLRGFAVEIARERQRRSNQIEDKDERRRAWLWGFGGEWTTRITHLLREARAMPPVADQAAWDTNPWLVGCPNGVLDLRTGALRPGRPEDRITKRTGIDYDPDARSPLFERVLHEVCCGDGDLIAFLQRAFGYSFTGDTREDAWFFCYGGGRNGKGTLINAVRGAIGAYAHELPASALDFAQRDKVPIDLAQLPGARFVTSAEVGSTIRLHHDRIKQITGGDPVTARGHHQAFFEFRPACKLWLAANDKPRVTDDSEGYWARVHLIPFLASFIGREDKTIRSALEQEPAHRRAVLAWLARGALAWQREGLNPPAVVTRATTAYRHEQQVLAPFYEACCLFQPDARVQASVLFGVYDKWCEAGGVPQKRRLSQTAFGREAKKRFASKLINGCVWYLGIASLEPVEVYSLDGR